MLAIEDTIGTISCGCYYNHYTSYPYGGCIGLFVFAPIGPIVDRNRCEAVRYSWIGETNLCLHRMTRRCYLGGKRELVEVFREGEGEGERDLRTTKKKTDYEVDACLHPVQHGNVFNIPRNVENMPN